MTAVDFHTGVADKLVYACRLLRKAHRSGEAVVVLGTPPDLARLDQMLWVFDPDAFIPHARWRVGAEGAVRLARAPIWLADGLDGLPAERLGVVVNLCPEAVPMHPDCRRVIEIVARDDADAAAGRARWRQYKAAGVPLRNHVQQDA